MIWKNKLIRRSFSLPLSLVQHVSIEFNAILFEVISKVRLELPILANESCRIELSKYFRVVTFYSRSYDIILYENISSNDQEIYPKVSIKELEGMCKIYV